MSSALGVDEGHLVGQVGPRREPLTDGAVLRRQVQDGHVAAHAVGELTGRPTDPTTHVEDAVCGRDLRRPCERQRSGEPMPVVVVDRRQLRHGDVLGIDALAAHLLLDGLLEA